MIKQKLLATTALISLFAGSALADGAAPVTDMSVKIGGMFDAQAITRKSSKKMSNVTKNHDDLGFGTDAQVYLEAKNSTAKGLEYGAHLGLTTHAVSTKNPSKGIDRSWMWLQHSDMGRFEFGSNNDVSSAMRVGADSVAVATGGIAGSWTQVVDGTVFGGTIDSPYEFILNPWDIGDNRVNFNLDDTLESLYREKARKVSYYTPKMNGFQAGVSYAPDLANKGITNAMPNLSRHATDDHDGEAKNVITAGLTWDGKVMNDTTGKFSLVGISGDSSDVYDGSVKKTEKLKGFDIGAMFKHKDLSAAVSYGSLGKSDYKKTATGKEDTSYVTAGLGYDYDKLHTSLTYMHGTRNHNKSHVVSLGAEYALALGIMPYAEATYFKLDKKHEGGLNIHRATFNTSTGSDKADSAAISQKKADGTVFILGTKIQF